MTTTVDGVSGAPGSVPALRVSSTPLHHPGELIELLDPQHPLAFLREGQGLIGIGEALRLEFSGPGRFAEAAATWQALVAAATVHDEVGVPGSGLAAFGSFPFAEHSAQPGVLIVPAVAIGRRDGTTWLTTIDDAALPPATPLRAAEPVRLRPGSLSPAHYRDAVVEAISRIVSGAAEKVVLARDLVGTAAPDADLRPVLARLAGGYPESFAFAVDRLLGASPETLVQLHGGVVTARVLAGTAARGADPEEDRWAQSALAGSAKDVAEHDFAVDSVLAALRPHCRDVRAGDTFTLRLPNLWHLASDVTGTLDDGAGALDLLIGLHPTAAVAGTPTPDAVAVIAELEPFDRGRYAGPVGWLDGSGNGTWAIALRCAHVASDGTVTAYAGAGIVRGSDPGAELAETELKFRPIVEAFG